MGFMESYKRLDNLCKDLYRSDRGISSYISDMEQHTAAARWIPGWEEAYRTLKHYRHIRNQIAHETDMDEQALCTAADVRWIEGFRERLLNRTDPLAQYTRMRQNRPARPTPPAYSAAYAPVKKPSPAKKRPHSGKSRTGMVGISVACLLLALILGGLFLWRGFLRT